MQRVISKKNFVCDISSAVWFLFLAPSRCSPRMGSSIFTRHVTSRVDTNCIVKDELTLLTFDLVSSGNLTFLKHRRDEKSLFCYFP